MDPEAVLWAVYHCERYDKHNRVPRFEKAFAPGGFYYKSDPNVRLLHARWGDYAACSFSNFQILFVTACELGFDGPPLALDHDSVALPWVVKYLNVRGFDKGVKSVEAIADAYNSGTHLDDDVPQRYVRKFVRMYDKNLTRLEREREEKKGDDATHV